MQDYVTAIGLVGFPVVFLIMLTLGLSIFVDKRAWPLLVKMIKDWQEFERKRAERDTQVMDRLVTVIENNTTALQQNVQTMQGFASRLDKVERSHRMLSKRFIQHVRGTKQNGN